MSCILFICLLARAVALPYSARMCQKARAENVSQACLALNKTKQNAKIRTVTESIVSQNIRGLKSDDRIEELVHSVCSRKVFAACLQETWRTGVETLEHSSVRLLFAGLEVPVCPRGSQGVGIVLSAAAVESWKAAGAVVHNDLGPRVISVRLLVKDSQRRDLFIYLVSAYAPIGSAAQTEWDQFFDKLDTCLARMEHGDVLVAGVDTNSSMGMVDVEHKQCHSAVGRFGLPHFNASGTRFASYLNTSNMRAVTTFFKKRSYATWTHPRSKLPHQIDHIITSGNELFRFTDAGVSDCLIDSDHRAVKCKLRIMKRLKKQSSPRELLRRLDCSVLKDTDTEKRYCSKVVEKYQNDNNDESYSRLAVAMSDAAKELLPKKKRAQPGWFEREEETLLSLIKSRNDAFNAYTARSTRSSHKKLKGARKKVKSAVTAAKNSWLMEKCRDLNEAVGAKRGTKSCWDTVSLLKKGFSKTTPATERMMTKEDGSKCVTSEDNANVFIRHFESLYGHQPEFEPDVLDALEQHAECGYGGTPDDEEIDKAVKKLKNKSPGISGLSPELFKAMLAEEESASLIRKMVVDFWESEIPPEEWEKGQLTILPKKGDLTLPGNYRGIMVLEVAYKIVAIILHGRLLPIEESLDHEAQCGFRPGRGTMDAIYTVRQAIKKRREHGLETWIVFLDLVKAFDRVPREQLWKVLRKFGVNEKLVRLLIALHAHVEVHFTVSGISSLVASIIGVKQGDVLGPILFIFYLAAVMNTWKSQYQRPLCIFMTKEDFVMTGRQWNAEGEELSLPDSEYADDTAVLFQSREETEVYSPLLIQHFRRWGLEIHVGTAKKKSKTEVLFAAARPLAYEDPETYDNCDMSNIDLGNGTFFPVVSFFQYLGSILSRDCKDDLDVVTRIDLAAAAFGSLRDCLFSSTRICLEAKKIVFEALILTILLYGSECWSLTEKSLDKLRVFFARCVRNMFRVTRKHTREHHISNDQLRNRLGLLSPDAYVIRHQLRWAGHVARMDWNRLPRKLISSWVPHKRMVGAPEYTYGRGLVKCLKRVELNKNDWFIAANDREQWKELCGTIQ